MGIAFAVIIGALIAIGLIIYCLRKRQRYMPDNSCRNKVNRLNIWAFRKEFREGNKLI